MPCVQPSVKSRLSFFISLLCFSPLFFPLHYSDVFLFSTSFCNSQSTIPQAGGLRMPAAIRTRFSPLRIQEDQRRRSGTSLYSKQDSRVQAYTVSHKKRAQKCALFMYRQQSVAAYCRIPLFFSALLIATASLCLPVRHTDGIFLFSAYNVSAPAHSDPQAAAPSCGLR